MLGLAGTDYGLPNLFMKPSMIFFAGLGQIFFYCLFMFRGEKTSIPCEGDILEIQVDG
jgi:hypothetical protein